MPKNLKILLVMLVPPKQYGGVLDMGVKKQDAAHEPECSYVVNGTDVETQRDAVK